MRYLLISILFLILNGCSSSSFQGGPVFIHVVYARCSLPGSQYGLCKAAWKLDKMMVWGRPHDRTPINGRISPFGHKTELIDTTIIDSVGYLWLETPIPNKYKVTGYKIDFGIDAEGNQWDKSYLIIEEYE